MGVPIPTVRHVLPSATPNPNFAFTSDDVLLHTTYGRIQFTDLRNGRTRTLSHEATRNLASISLSANRLLVTDTASRALLFAPPYARPFGRLSLRFRVLACALSPDASLAAFAGDRLQVWRVPDTPVPQFAAWEKVAEFAPGITSSASLTWSRDGRRVAVGLSTGAVVVYTLQERLKGVSVKALTLHGHRAPIISIHFVGERGLTTLSADGALFCWRLRFNDLLPDYEPQQFPYVADNPTRNPNRRLFAVPISARLASRHFVKQGGCKRVRSADVADPLIVVGLSSGVFVLYELPDHMTREDAEFDDGLFELGETAALKKVAEREGNKKKRKKRRENAGDEVEDEEDGESSDSDNDSSEEEDDDDDAEETGRRTGFTELTLLHMLSISGGAISRIAFNAKGAWIAMASAQSGQVVVWDWRGETHVLKQQAHTKSVRSAAFSPDGRALATGGTDGRVKLWGVHTGFCVSTFSNHEAEVTAVTFAAKDVILSASIDGTVRAFDIRRYRNFRIMVGPPPRRKFGCVTADEAGELVAAGCVDSFEIIVWSLRTGQVVEVLNGHKGPVSGLAFRPRRGTLASSSWDRTIRLWDMYERKGTCEVLEHNKEVLDVAFRPDGRELAGCTTMGEIVIWDAEGGNIVGTIDGARDAKAGRRRESRTVASEQGHFQSVCYSVDGRFIIGGAAAKHMCFYHVAEGSRPALVRKVAVTENVHFDGVHAMLNSKLLTDSGHVLEEVDDDDEAAENYDEVREGKKRSLPGARTEEEAGRRNGVLAEVRCVAACRTGRMWAAVTGEGVLVYGDGEEEDGDGVFDPTCLDVEVTPAEARRLGRKGRYGEALTVALRLNEREVVSEVLDVVPVGEIEVVMGMLSKVYFGKLVGVLAWKVENGLDIERNLLWAKTVLMGMEQGTVVAAEGNRAALRALHRACMGHFSRLAPLADDNEYMLKYIGKMREREVVVPKKGVARLDQMEGDGGGGDVNVSGSGETDDLGA